MKRRFIWSVGFLLVLMYFSMGYMMWGWPLPAFYDDNHVAMGLSSFCVVSNALRLNLFDLRDEGKDKKSKESPKSSIKRK